MSATVTYEDKIRQNNRRWKLEISVYDTYAAETATFQLTNQDVILGTFSYDEASVCSDCLDVGSTYANSVSFTIKNDDSRFSQYVFTNAQLVPVLSLFLGSNEEDERLEYWESIPLGTFYVSEVSRKHSTIAIQALDGMYALNKPVETLLPATPEVILQDIITHTGILVENETQQAIMDITEEPINLSDKTTCRDFIGYCAAFYGKSARFNRNGKLEFFDIVGTREIAADKPVRTSLTKSDYSVHISGVSVTDAKQETYFHGDDSYVVEIPENPLLVTDELTQKALTNAFNALTQISYIPYSCVMISDPSVRCGERVCFDPENNPDDVSIITHMSFNFRGTMQISASGKAPQSSQQLSSTERRMIELRQKTQEELTEKLSHLEEITRNQNDLLMQSLGLHAYVKPESDENGPAGYYLTDNEDPDNATIRWSFSSNAIAVWKKDENGRWTAQSSWGMNDTFVAHCIATYFLTVGVIQSTDGSLRIDLENSTMMTQSETGNCTIDGKDLTLSCFDANKNKVSSMKMSADAVDNDDLVQMKMVMASKENPAISGIEQHFTIDSEDVRKYPLKIFGENGVVFDRNIAVNDSILYDSIKMQRKYQEYENTGVDFIFSSHPLANPPINLFARIDNPGFEGKDENGIETYSPWSVVSGNASYLSVVSSSPHSGTGCLKIFATGLSSTELVRFKSSIKIPAGSYYFGFWYKSTTASLPASIAVASEDTLSTDSQYLYGWPTATSNWDYLSCLFTTSSEKFLYFNAYVSNDVEMYFDDMFLCNADGYNQPQIDEYIKSLYIKE